MTTDRKIDMAEPEALSQELKRLVGEHLDPDAGDSTKEEAWNYIADFTIEHADIICAALARRSPVAVSEEMVRKGVEAYERLIDGCTPQQYDELTDEARVRAILTAALVSPAVTAPRVRKLERPPLVWDGDTEPDGFNARQNLADIIANPSTPTADELAQAQAALARMDAREAAVPIASAEPVASEGAVLLCRYVGTNKYMGSRFWAECDSDEPRRADYEYRWLYALPIASAGEAGWPDKTVAQIWDERDRLRAELDEARATERRATEDATKLAVKLDAANALVEQLSEAGIRRTTELEAASSALASMREALTIARTTLSELFEHHLHNTESGCEAWNDVGGAVTLHHIDAALKEGTPS